MTFVLGLRHEPRSCFQLERRYLPTQDGRTLCAACGCHLLQAPRAPELLPDTRAFPKPDSWGHGPLGNHGAWHTGVAETGRLKVGLGKGSWSGSSTEFASVLAGHQPEPEEENLWPWGESCKLCLVPDFENTQMLVYKSEGCLGAISVPSLIQTVLSVSTRDQGFTVSLPSGSP